MSTALGKFGVIGGAGFAIEAVLLTVLTQSLDWEPWQARVPSFLTAVLATWLLNRAYTFRGRVPERRSVEALSYVGIQVCGACINLAVFALCLKRWPQLRAVPVVPLAVGAAAGFAFNFIASSTWLYARTRPGARH